MLRRRIAFRAIERLSALRDSDGKSLILLMRIFCLI
jgi:hypothetical protein